MATITNNYLASFDPEQPQYDPNIICASCAMPGGTYTIITITHDPDDETELLGCARCAIADPEPLPSA